MKEETKNQKIIKEVGDLLKKYKRNPTQVRYIFKKVRENYGYQIPNSKAKELPKFLTPAQIHTLIDVAYNYENFTGILIETLIFTGLRINEANNLMVHHISFDNNQIFVEQGKGGKDRYIPLTPSLSNSIRIFLNNKKKGYVFSKKDGTQYTKRALQYKVDKAAEKARLPNWISPHNLRHTFATMLRSKGMSIQDIQGLMGHTDIQTTQIYSKMELGPVKERFIQLTGGYNQINNKTRF